MKVLNTHLVLAPLVFLTACGGSGSSDPSNGALAGIADAYIENERRLTGAELSEFSDIPVTGSANFEGSALVVYEPTAQFENEFVALGRAAIEADFENASITAEAGSFHEITNTQDILAVRSAEDFVGADLNGEAIAGQVTFDLQQRTGENIYLGSAEGTITSRSNRTFAFTSDGDPNASGVFVGTNAEGVSLFGGGPVDGGTLLLGVRGFQD